MAKLRMILIGTATYLFASPVVYCQTLTPEEKGQWFPERIGVWLGLGFIAGTIASFAWLRRVKYVPENLSIDAQVRRRFVVALVLGVIAFSAAVWLDFWLFATFETILEGPLEAMSEAYRSWQTLVLTILATAMFYVASLAWTRGAFSGRYALWPGPKRQ